jgi:hypothetical protein
LNYRFTGHDARFYPEIRDLEGKSLMAETGTVFDFEELPPSDGLWVPVEASAEQAQEAVPVNQGAPEPPPAPVAPEPVPEPSAPSPEAVPEPPAPAPAAPSPAVPVSPATPFSFPGFAPPAQPYSR